MFGEDSDARIRAKRLDEGLEILSGLWSGDPVRYDGEHYQLKDVTFKPSPLQSPRIPVWIGGAWPNRGPFRRAAKWDGVVPMKEDLDQITPQEILEIRSYIQQHRTSSNHFDVAIGGQTPIDDQEEAVEIVSPYIRVGLTWWLEDINGLRGSLREMNEKIKQGPPKRM
jgi:alkanesulfonate monooxygenase SsuD/methylene tetrahydromethanopterin reductase-like flavin-dependent oxidoreductase (luciferase family)